MAKIVSKVQYSLFDSEAKKRRWDHRHKSGYHKVTRYDSKDEVFIIHFPDYMKEVLGRNHVRGGTQKIVDVHFKEGIREYNLRIASKRKVIAYSLLATVDDKIEGKQFTRTELNFYGDNEKYVTGLALWYAVCWETKADRGLKFFALDGKEVSTPTFRKHPMTMDYTPEREAFFTNFKHQIALLVHNASEFLNQTDKLLKLIDSSHLLLNLPFLDQQEGRRN